MRPALALAIILLSIATPNSARGQSSQAAMEEYFRAERLGGGVLIGMGATGLTAGALLYADGGDRARGASYPLLVFGLAHTAAGVFVAITSTRRMSRFRVQIASDEPGFLAAERPRMERVSRQLSTLTIVEIALGTAGLAVASFGYLGDHDEIEGVGLALAGEAGATLVFDVFAARRADRYRARLGATAGTDPATGARTGWLVYTGGF